MSDAGLLYEGSLSIGALCPIVVSGYSSTLTELQARLAGVIALQAHITATPPSYAAGISACEALIANIEVCITLGIPIVDFSISACTTAIAALEASLGILSLLESLFGTAGIMVYTWDGPGRALGPALAGALAGTWPDGTPGGSHSNALILATTNPASWNAMLAFFGGA